MPPSDLSTARRTRLPARRLAPPCPQVGLSDCRTRSRSKRQSPNRTWSSPGGPYAITRVATRRRPTSRWSSRFLTQRSRSIASRRPCNTPAPPASPSIRSSTCPTGNWKCTVSRSFRQQGRNIVVARSWASPARSTSSWKASWLHESRSASCCRERTVAVRRDYGANS